MALSESLSKLDVALVDRIAVPMRILMDDYTSVAGDNGTAASESNCETQFRLLATAWVGPWGSVIPWLLPPSSIVTVEKTTTIVLRIPQSRVRHFLSDASIHVAGGTNFRISRAVLRLGPDRVIQSLDSEFACRVALIYKQGREVAGLPTAADPAEQSTTLVTPLFFDMPLSILPLFIPNTPLPEIEYDIISDVAGSPPTDIQIITEVVSSPGEVGIPPTTAASAATGSGEVIVQHLPTMTTFSSSTIEEATSSISVSVSSKDGKLARALYIRVFDATCHDIPDAIESIDVIAPPPRVRSLLGTALPGSLCRTHFKRRFSRLPLASLPYYVIPFTATPDGRTADYGLVLPEGTQVKIVLTSKKEGISAQVCVETFERVVWKR